MAYAICLFISFMVLLMQTSSILQQFFSILQQFFNNSSWLNFAPKKQIQNTLNPSTLLPLFSLSSPFLYFTPTLYFSTIMTRVPITPVRKSDERSFSSPSVSLKDFIVNEGSSTSRAPVVGKRREPKNWTRAEKEDLLRALQMVIL